MATENTSFQNTTPAGDSTKTNGMVIGKSNTHQRTFLIVAGSLLALLVLIAVAGKSSGQNLTSSAYEMDNALVDFQVDTSNLSFLKDIFGMKEGSCCSCGRAGATIGCCEDGGSDCGSGGWRSCSPLCSKCWTCSCSDCCGCGHNSF